MATEQITRTAPDPSTPVPDGGAPRRDRLTMAGGWSLLAICVLHTAVLAAQPWWGQWLAGPLRTTPLPPESMAGFWALPGSFVVVGALLALSLIATGRRGEVAPLYVPVALAAWAALCVWIVGPSGFLTAIVPVVLLTLGNLRRRRPR